MRKGSVGIVTALFGVALAFSQATHDVSVVNIAVPVRVFDGGRFVDSLKLEDFEIAEDGKPQSVLAAYLVRGGDIRRREGPLISVAPVTRRHFVLVFQTLEYLPELGAALHVFFDEVLRAADGVDVVTPRKTYRLAGSIDSEEARRWVERDIISKVRQDTLIDSGAYDSVIRDLTANLASVFDPSRGDSDTLNIILDAYAANLRRLEAFQTIDLKKMAVYADELKKIPGAKHLFFFSQRELVPQFSNRALAAFLTEGSSEMSMKVQELMSRARGAVSVNREAIQRAFADASVDVHFLYITKTRKEAGAFIEMKSGVENIAMGERFGDIYGVFREIAAATGGTADASSNPSDLLKRAAEASEHYYLLYYQPQNYKADGEFHAITVKVRKGRYRLSHRAGYMATEELSSTAAENPDEHPADRSIQEPAAGIPPDIETISPESRYTPAPAESLLRSAAAYCRRLQDAALFFICREEVGERVSKALLREPETGVTLREWLMLFEGADRYRHWAYDYQLMRRQGRFRETRILLEGNGQVRHAENARLSTERFWHSNVILGPLGLLGEESQKIHWYRVIKELDMEGEPAIVLDVNPKGEGQASLYGKAWVRIRDGAVLKIEWTPASMGNYDKIEMFAQMFHAKPLIAFASEYAFEKNGLRFPSSYSVEEAYLAGERRLSLSKTDVVYKDYKFFQVQTEVKF
jgi:VWFA-related protein